MGIGLLGRKVGMTQIYDETGRVIPVTVLQAGPCHVLQLRSEDRDGYEAVQLGLVDPAFAKRANKPSRGHHEKAGVPPTRVLREFRLLGDDEVKPGDAISVEIFDEKAMAPGWTSLDSAVFDHYGNGRWFGYQIHRLLRQFGADKLAEDATAGESWESMRSKWNG